MSQAYDRHSIVPLAEGLDAIRTAVALVTRQKRVRGVLNGMSVNLRSLRLRTFAAKGTKCVVCGREATHFAIERDTSHTESDVGYHLNLWGVNEAGEEVLFTHDHIVARGLGGKDHFDNTQTMCGPCNWDKGKVEQQEAERRRVLCEPPEK